MLINKYYGGHRTTHSYTATDISFSAFVEQRAIVCLLIIASSGIVLRLLAFGENEKMFVIPSLFETKLED